MSAERGYIPGKAWDGGVPLARYLPRVEEGPAVEWLRVRLPAGGLVVDPFGSSPSLALEVAQAGHAVLVAANNPIAKFLIEVAADAPQKEQFMAALAELSAARRGEERLEPHILSLYETRCDQCDASVSAEAFLWRREESAPFARVYSCPQCGYSGEFPATDRDRSAAADFASSGLHRSRALERIAPAGSPHRQHAEEALEVYPPRAMYALSTLVNKLDGLSIPREQRRLLEAMLLVSMDEANSMWAHPRGRTRPKQLSIPNQFREHNIWYSMERSIPVWEAAARKVAVAHWPEVAVGGGITLYEGRVRDISQELGKLDVAAVVSALPRPNQAYWTLCALWTGWLWGHEALGAFGSVLARRRYDWNWHTGALYSALHHLSSGLAAGAPVFGMVTESEARFEAAALAAGHGAGLMLEQIDMRPQEGQAQITWVKGRRKAAKPPLKELSSLVESAAAGALAEFGQPAEYARLQAAALQQLEGDGQLAALGSSAGDVYTESRSLVERAVSFSGRLRRFGGGEGELESGLWWLSQQAASEQPMADRVEMAVVRYMQQNPGSSLQAIDAAICQTFSGTSTPARTLVEQTARSYGRAEGDEWVLNDADTPQARRDDLQEMRALVATLGETLGYQVSGEQSLLWMDGPSRVRFCFHVQASALLQDAITHEHTGEGSYFVLPGGRAELVLYKLRADPRLQELVETGWKFVKFRSLRQLAQNPAVRPDSIEELLNLDPLTEDDQQIPLL